MRGSRLARREYGLGRDRRAVVVGSGLAGLLAARVLLDHFDQVTILDRDRFPDTPEHRKGVPQSYHAHGLLLHGRDIIEQLFPDIDTELRAHGASPARDSVPLQVVCPFGPLPITPMHDEFIMYSRVLLEFLLRQRLTRDYPHLQVLPEVDALGLLTDAGGQVSGVQVRHRNGSGPDTLESDLVVDASGRGSKAPEWLATLGYGPVPEQSITSGIGYASRFYAKPEGFPGYWTGVVINGRSPHNRRAGLILDVERGQWHVTLGGFANAAPPLDETGFLQWARDLPDPTIYEAIRIARPLTPIRGFRTPTNRLRHFDRLPGWPAGIVVTGDAVCAFNPIYGQGMTVAATDALVLRTCLRHYAAGTKPGFERAFQRRLATNVAIPWFVASMEDLRWPGVEHHGTTPQLGTTMARRWIDLMLRAAVRNRHLADKYVDVIMMNAHPRVLFSPGVIARVLTVAVSGKIGIPSQEFALPDPALAALRDAPTPSSQPVSLVQRTP